jgi:hypothetical protein
MSPTNTSQKQGCAEKFGHSTIIELAKKFYYNGKPDCLSVLFPDCFKTCPSTCLTMAYTTVGIPFECYFFGLSQQQIVNCLNKYKGDFEIKIPFTGEQYKSVHTAMLSLIEQLWGHDYHGPKLVVLCEKIATEGQSVGFLPPYYTDFVTRLQNLKR